MAVPVIDELLSVDHPVFDHFEDFEEMVEEGRRDTIPSPPPDFDHLGLDDEALDAD
jgi:hypothetical protein